MFQDPQTGKFRAQKENILYKLKPEEGMVLVFDHRILHEGEEVLNGKKYILRTELLYTCLSRKTTPQEEEVERLVQLAQNAEAFRKEQEAVEYYKLARKACKDNPSLAAQWGLI